MEKGKEKEMEGEGDNSQSLPTKQDMAEMMSHLECMIKGELNATRAAIQNVIKRVEESEVQLDKHKKLSWNYVRGRNWIG